MKSLEARGFRIIEPGDGSIRELAELEALCFPSDPWSEQMIEDCFKNGNCIIFAVEDIQLSKIVAYSVLYTAADQADLANIAVLPQYRRRGLGGCLLDCTLKAACNRGALQVFLEVRASNAGAMSLYTAAGFTQVGVRKNYYARPREDAVIMLWEPGCADGEE